MTSAWCLEKVKMLERMRWLATTASTWLQWAVSPSLVVMPMGQSGCSCLLCPMMLVRHEFHLSCMRFNENNSVRGQEIKVSTAESNAETLSKWHLVLCPIIPETTTGTSSTTTPASTSTSTTQSTTTQQGLTSGSTTQQGQTSTSTASTTPSSKHHAEASWLGHSVTELNLEHSLLNVFFPFSGEESSTASGGQEGASDSGTLLVSLSACFTWTFIRFHD